MDCLRIHRLRASCIVGDEAWERTTAQPVTLDLALWRETRAAAASDALHDAVDYAAVAGAVRAYIAGTRFRLIEALAEGVAALCLAQFSVARVTVALYKPSHLDGVETFSVEITRP